MPVSSECFVCGGGGCRICMSPEEARKILDSAHKTTAEVDTAKFLEKVVKSHTQQGKDVGETPN